MGMSSAAGERYHSRMDVNLNWDRIDTVLLDMDGTVLDLSFDNYFWLQHVPRTWGEQQGLDRDAAMAELMPHFTSLRGSLRWYCLDHWSELLDLDVEQMKRDCAERIRLLPGAEDFLARVRDSGRRLLLVTNAHPAALAIKLECCPIGDYFEHTVSTHAWGMPKEHPEFWPIFARDCAVDLSRSLFIDDSEAVLSGAQAGGVAQLCGILAPDTTIEPREPFGDWAHVHSLAELPVPSASDRPNRD